MLVKHLIRELQHCNPDSEVWTEGCDCIGETYSVSHETDGSVMINRPARGIYQNGEDTPEPLG